MGRHNLHIAVPTFFRCPISLDIMKSPVSLCTGVTYDRTSIQRWLDSGNNTCPATMQLLQTKDLVPNKTLQRLIQIWSTDSSSSTDSKASLHIATLLNELSNGLDNPLPTLERIESLATQNKRLLLNFDGFLDFLVGFLVKGDNVCLMEFAVRIMETIIQDDKDKGLFNHVVFMRRQDFVNGTLLVLQLGKLSSKIASVKVVEAMAGDVESKVLVAETNGVLSVLLNSVFASGSDDLGLAEACLSCLITVSKPKRVRIKLIHLQVVKIVTNLLTDQNATVSMVEKGLKVLEMVSACKEGRMEICNDAGCVSGVVRKVLKVSTVATEHAVTLLWSVCFLFRDVKAQESVLKSNGLTKFLLLIQSNCSPSVRQMAGDLIKVFRVNCKSCLGSYETKTTHIMPF